MDRRNNMVVVGSGITKEEREEDRDKSVNCISKVHLSLINTMVI